MKGDRKNGDLPLHEDPMQVATFDRVSEAIACQPGRRKSNKQFYRVGKLVPTDERSTFTFQYSVVALAPEEVYEKLNKGLTIDACTDKEVQEHLFPKEETA